MTMQVQMQDYEHLQIAQTPRAKLHDDVPSREERTGPENFHMSRDPRGTELD
jgi:hypothetical protein